MNQNERIGEVVAWLAERGCWPQLANQDSDGPRGWMVCRTVGVCGSDQVSDVHATMFGALEQAFREMSTLDPDTDREYRELAADYAAGRLPSIV